MAETIRKGILLAAIQNGYERLEALLSSLSEQQMTAMQVNGTWSVKDTLAHLTTWQGYLLDQPQGVVSGKQPPAFMPGLTTEDEINERVYQVHKDRPLAEVLAEFHALPHKNLPHPTSQPSSLLFFVDTDIPFQALSWTFTKQQSSVEPTTRRLSS